MPNYETRVRAMEAQGMTRSDAQSVIDAEDLKTMTADRSDSHAFYDPEHPANNMMPTTGERWYSVTVLCDDGELFTWEGWAFNPDQAKDRAWIDAQNAGMRPVSIDACTCN